MSGGSYFTRSKARALISNTKLKVVGETSTMEGQTLGEDVDNDTSTTMSLEVSEFRDVDQFHEFSGEFAETSLGDPPQCIETEPTTISVASCVETEPTTTNLTPVASPPEFMSAIQQLIFGMNEMRGVLAASLVEIRGDFKASQDEIRGDFKASQDEIRGELSKLSDSQVKISDSQIKMRRDFTASQEAMKSEILCHMRSLADTIRKDFHVEITKTKTDLEGQISLVKQHCSQEIEVVRKDSQDSLWKVSKELESTQHSVAQQLDHTIKLEKGMRDLSIEVHVVKVTQDKISVMGSNDVINFMVKRGVPLEGSEDKSVRMSCIYPFKYLGTYSDKCLGKCSWESQICGNPNSYCSNQSGSRLVCHVLSDTSSFGLEAKQFKETNMLVLMRKTYFEIPRILCEGLFSRHFGISPGNKMSMCGRKHVMMQDMEILKLSNIVVPTGSMLQSIGSSTVVKSHLKVTAVGKRNFRPSYRNEKCLKGFEDPLHRSFSLHCADNRFRRESTHRRPKQRNTE